MTESEYMDRLVECGIATDEEITLVCNICGTTIETLDKILYARTSYNSWDQYVSCKGIE